MIKGLRTAIYPVTDLAQAKAWYAAVFERPPYFDEPFYVGFSIGGFELGLIPDGVPGAGGAKPLWGVPDLAAELVRLRALGVSVTAELQEVGSGIKVADIADPFGNAVGLIENPHFDPAKVE